MDTFKYCVLIAALVCVQNITAAVIGESCTADPQPVGNCTGQGVQCIEENCGCSDDYYPDGDNCILNITFVLKENCSSPDQCITDNATCLQNGTCGCYDDFYAQGNNTCIRKLNLGSDCTGSNQCGTGNATCQIGKCHCDTDFYPDEPSTCIQKSNHGGSCSNNSHCRNSLECNMTSGQPWTCVCQDGNYYNGTLPCVAKSNHGGSCSNNSHCRNSLECNMTSGQPWTCVCQDGNYYNGTLPCVAKSSHGGSCSNTNHCGNSLECYIPTSGQPGKCVCQDGNYYTGTLPCVASTPLTPTIQSYTSTYNSITVKWTRQADPTEYTSRYGVLLNGISTEVTEANKSPVLIPSLNSSTTYAIRIIRYISAHGRQQTVISSLYEAVTKSNHGDSCNSDDDCATSLVCFGQTSKVCVCSSGTYYAGSLPCVSITRLVPTFDILSSGLNNITVTFTNILIVDGKYTDVLTAHLNPGNINKTIASSGNTVIDGLSKATVYTVTVTRTITFVQRPQTTAPTQPQYYSTKVVYGSACRENGTCNNDDANCYGLKCLCNTGFYWNNAQCETITNLAPHTITSETVKTTSAVIGWVESDKKAFVSGYRVDAARTNPGDPDHQPVEVNGTSTNLTGLQPGTEYDVTVSAKSTNEERVEHVAGTPIKVFTKPATIAGINDDKSNFAGPDIIIAFNPAAVKYTGYTVRLKGIGSDGYDETRTATKTNNVYSVTFPGVTSGNYYDITVVTLSGSIESDPFTSRRRVMASQAGEVQELNRTAITSRSVYVTWKRPNNTNGILFEYRLEVSKNTTCVFRIVFNCTECAGNRTDDAMSNNCPVVDTIDITEANINDENHINKYNITGLDPVTRYFLVAVAYTEEGRGKVPRNEIYFQTDTEAARAPKYIRSTRTTSDNITLMWEPEPPRPGVTSYEITVYEKKEDGDEFDMIGNRTILGYYNRSLVITDLSSYWKYYFSIQAYTHVLPRSPIVNISETVTTAESPPTEVEYIETDKVEGKFNMVRVKWKCPKQKDGRNGVINSANLTYYPLAKTVEQPMYGTKIYINNNDCVWEEEVEVTPEYTYRFTVSLKNKYYGGDNSTNRSVPAGPPFHGRQVSIRNNGQSDSQTSVPVVLSPKALYSGMNGKVTLTGVVVCKGNCPSRKRRQAENKLYYDKLSSWKTSKSNDFGSPYRATPDDWIDDKKSENEVTFTVGNNASCDSAPEKEFCNGQLPPGTSFNIYVFACTSAGCSETDKITVITKQTPVNIGLIAGAVGGVVAAIILVIIVVLVVRCMRRPLTTKLDPEEIEEELIVKKRLNNESQRRPIRICNFEKRVEEMHKDSNLLFSEEFEDINALSPKHPCIASETGSNKLKNRYVNILPFDHSRVKLLPTEEDEEETDYINGNYIPGYRSQREYIATQGPMTGTVNDFWRMIWEQSVPIIVMLSDLSEKGKPKVDRYYPENMEPVQYGDIIVEMTNFSPLNKYVIRIFKLQLGDEVRMVRHYFLPGWQDFGANLTSDDVINFLKSVRMEIKPNNQGPLCIHCSAGVGRTGTYITLDVFQQYIDEEDMNKEMDIFDFTMKMRQNRSYMIQTEKQYIFVHDTIKEMIIRKKKEMSERDHIYQNSNTDDSNVYENQAFEADPQDIYMNVDPTGKPTTAL